MDTKDVIYVGQNITLAVELLAPGYFDSSPSFDLPDAQGLLLMPPVGRPVVSSEQIDGVSFTVQRHEIAVLSERAGVVTVPSLTVRFRYKKMPLDKESVPATVKTEPVKFTVTLPPGAEKLGHLISARNLQVTETWNPDPATAKPKAGDAFTRTITFTAPDVPGMMFPPFPAGSMDGIRTYAKEPEVNDQTDRGDLTGQRRDTTTYALQRAGAFTIPAVRFTWWDLDAKELRTVDFPERKIQVAPNPALPTEQKAAATAVPSKRPGWKTMAGIAALLLALLFLATRPKVRSGMRKLISLFRPVHLQPLNPPPATRTPESSTL
jgi:hypothetical protein